MGEYGWKEKAEGKKITMERRTRESKVSVSAEASARRDFRINTGVEFLNHMIETIAWRACINIDAQCTGAQFRLKHVIAEDTGIVLGAVFGKMAGAGLVGGINASGCCTGVMEEAMALAGISFEGRANCFVDTGNCRGACAENVEDIPASDLAEFFFGFSQGAKATVNIRILSGQNPHHTWEAVFRGFGEALKSCLAKNGWRAGTTPGVKGTMG